MLEAGGARLGGAVQVATGILVQLAQDPTAKSATRLKAIQMILNRAGLPEVTKHEVQVKRELSDTEKIERAVALAKSLGLDPRTLLGNVGVTLPAEPSPPQGEVTVEAEDIEIVASTSGIEDLLPPGFAL